MICIWEILNDFNFEINEITWRIIIQNLFQVYIIIEEIYKNIIIWEMFYIKNYNSINIIIIFYWISEFKEII